MLRLSELLFVLLCSIHIPGNTAHRTVCVKIFSKINGRLPGYGVELMSTPREGLRPIPAGASESYWKCPGCMFRNVMASQACGSCSLRAAGSVADPTAGEGLTEVEKLREELDAAKAAAAHANDRLRLLAAGLLPAIVCSFSIAGVLGSLNTEY